MKRVEEEKQGRQFAEAAILDATIGLRPKDIQSVLLGLFDMMVSTLQPADILSKSSENRFVTPALVSQREILFIDSLIYEAVPPEFESLALSPVGPLGTNAVLTNLSQKNILTTVRGLETVGAVTPMLSLESAKRRKKLGKTEMVHLASSHRNIRAQLFSTNKNTEAIGFTPHFQLFALASAGFAENATEFAAVQTCLHLGTLLNFYRLANKSGHFNIQDITVDVSDLLIAESLINKNHLDRHEIGKQTTNQGFSILEHTGSPLSNFVESMADITPKTASSAGLTVPIEHLRYMESAVIVELRETYPEVTFRFDLSRIAGIGYFTDSCYKLKARNKEGRDYPLVDGGISNWNARLLADKRERFYGSGFGSELFGRFFKAD